MNKLEGLETAKRQVNPNSLLGLLYTLRSHSEKLDVRIGAIEKRLRDEGVKGRTRTTGEVADLLARRGSKGMFCA